MTFGRSEWCCTRWSPARSHLTAGRWPTSPRPSCGTRRARCRRRFRKACRESSGDVSPRSRQNVIRQRARLEARSRRLATGQDERLPVPSRRLRPTAPRLAGRRARRSCFACRRRHRRYWFLRPRHHRRSPNLSSGAPLPRARRAGTHRVPRSRDRRFDQHCTVAFLALARPFDFSDPRLARGSMPLRATLVVRSTLITCSSARCSRHRIGSRATVQLVKTSDSSIVWGDRYDVGRVGICSVSAIRSPSTSRPHCASGLTEAERERFYRRYTTNAAAYERYLQGRAALVRYTGATPR